MTLEVVQAEALRLAPGEVLIIRVRVPRDDVEQLVEDMRREFERLGISERVLVILDEEAAVDFTVVPRDDG